MILSNKGFPPFLAVVESLLSESKALKESFTNGFASVVLISVFFNDSFAAIKKLPISSILYVSQNSN